jgi:hypothetical protein
VEAVLPGAYVDINRAGVVAEVQEFSRKGFSGEVRYRVDQRGKHRCDFAVYHEDLIVPPNSHAIVSERQGAIDLWLTHPGTVIVFQFNRGKIHKVETRDPIPGIGDP